jgi:hypothetical protein
VVYLVHQPCVDLFDLRVLSWGGGAGVLIGLSLYYTYTDLGKIFELGKTVQSRFHRVLILLGLFFCISTVTQALFPERVVVDGMVVNILAHYVGYMVGFFVPAMVSVF